MSLRQKCIAGLFRVFQARVAQGVDHGLAQRSGAWISSQGQLAAQQQTSSTAGLFANRSAGMSFSRSFAAEAKAAAAGTTARPAARAGAKAAAGSQAANAAGAAGSSQKLSPFEQWRRNFQRVPSVPKWLGLTGAIPFIALAPPVCKHLAPLLPTTISENCAMIQVCYGVIIVTFLGAVHWGMAMSSPLTSPIALKLANEAYVYSVIPSLVAWPVALMEPGVGSLVLSLLLPGCYLADYTRRNLGMPAWYMTLRVPLTLLATFGMLLTATRHLHAEMDKVKEAEEAAGAAASRA